MDAFVEFLTENKFRRYPFVEDSTVLSSDGEYSLPNSIILDLRGFHRERPELKPQLVAIIGSMAASISTLDAVAGEWSLFFAMGNLGDPLVFRVGIPEDNTIWPFQAEVSVVDPKYPERDVRLGHIRVTVGEDILDVSQSFSCGFENTALIEPSLVAELYQTQVDFVKLIHTEGASEFVGGDLKIVGGYNTEVSLDTKGILITSSRGSGTLGQFTGSTLDPSASACRGRIFSINGSMPDQRGRFFIKGTNGVSIKDLPDQHKIQIVLSTELLGGNKCS